MGKMKTQANNVKVMVRVRPFNKREIGISEEKGEPLKCVVDMSDDVVSVLDEDKDFDEVKEGHEYQYDNCFWSIPEEICVHFPMSMNGFADQVKVYNVTGAEALTNAWAAFNTCIFAYGQTGSGKSYSMLGTIDGDHMGISPRIIEGLFEQIEADKTEKPKVIYKIECTFIEIYNEQVKDLFAKKKSADYAAVKIRQHPVFGVQVVGLESKELKNAIQGKKEMDHGIGQRALASTNMNATSSRSHAIFQVHVHTSYTDSKSTGHATINLVDLAGSERIGKTGASGQTADEGKAINKSLSTLRKVIDTLIENSKGGKAIPPYRESMLTWVLKDSLGGNSKTMMICTISPHADNIEDTISTLRYGLKAKAIVCKAVKQEVSVDKQARELKAQIAELEAALQAAADGGGGGMSEEEQAQMKEEMQAELEAAQEEMERNNQVLNQMVLKEKQNAFAAAFRSAFIIEKEKGATNLIVEEKEKALAEVKTLEKKIEAEKKETEKKIEAEKKKAQELVAEEKKRGEETLKAALEEEKEHAEMMVENAKEAAASVLEKEKKRAAEELEQVEEEAGTKLKDANKASTEALAAKDKTIAAAEELAAQTQKTLEKTDKVVESRTKELEETNDALAQKVKLLEQAEVSFKEKNDELAATIDNLRETTESKTQIENDLASAKALVKKTGEEKKLLSEQLRCEEGKRCEKEEEYKKLDGVHRKLKDEKLRQDGDLKDLTKAALKHQASQCKSQISLAQSVGLPLNEVNMLQSYTFDDDEFCPEEIDIRTEAVHKAISRHVAKLVQDLELEKKTREMKDEELYRMKTEHRDTTENMKRQQRTLEESLMRERQKSVDIMNQLKDYQVSSKRNEEILRDELRRQRERSDEEMCHVKDRAEYERNELLRRDEEQRQLLATGANELEELRGLVQQLQSELYLAEESITDLQHRKDHYKKQCMLLREMHEADTKIINSLSNERTVSGDMVTAAVKMSRGELGEKANILQPIIEEKAGTIQHLSGALGHYEEAATEWLADPTIVGKGTRSRREERARNRLNMQEGLSGRSRSGSRPRDRSRGTPEQPDLAKYSAYNAWEGSTYGVRPTSQSPARGARVPAASPTVMRNGASPRFPK
eukprot:TRINITY_DN1988_c2_g1_i1.p1 TRINITY_DN1988_c2_g1~~TRINITY_DN1988_c2_g1_i1.p1  ORF type:complete len:1115 (+),score=519.76 TRINITY_DN1988_c2_g1_i1:95-3439(+)